MTRELTIGYSPCPNDTYIFYALIHGKVHVPVYVSEEMVGQPYARLVPQSARDQLATMLEESVLEVERASIATFAGVHKVFLAKDGKAQERLVELGSTRGERVSTFMPGSTGRTSSRRRAWPRATAAACWRRTPWRRAPGTAWPAGWRRTG